MADALPNILNTPSTHYSLFEPNQVLASQQLNSLALYVNYQEHLARVKLLGVGIVDGLQVRRSEDSVTIRRGVGITTDGDLVVLAADRSFNRFRLYGPEAPRYAPFYEGDAMRTVYELTEQPEAEPLSTLPTPLDEMVVVTLVERYEDDPDFCSTTDCDNLGKTIQDHLRCLLISRSDANGLLTAPETVRQQAAKLSVLFAARPLIGRGMSSTALLQQVYVAACTAIQQTLLGHLGELHAHLPALVEETFGNDPTPGWTTALGELQARMAAADHLHFQYYYDFLRDLVEHWNELREALLADASDSPVEADAFPRHLVLGALSNPREFRTGLFPSPLIQGNQERHERAIFLLRKLGKMIEHCSLPVPSAAAIRVTPSRTESARLEERSIPWYYAADIQPDWSFRFGRHAAASENLGYHITGSDVFSHQIGCYDFFRVEGHQGQHVTAAKEAIEKIITNHNLPFIVRAVLLHHDRQKVTARPSIRYSDLHRLHHLFRKELATQLGETKLFNERFSTELKTAADEHQIPERDTTQPTLIRQAADQALLSLNQPTFSDYMQTRQTQDWRNNFKTVVNVSNSFKGTVSDVFRTNYVTAFDSLLTNNHSAWLEWLESLIVSRDEQEDEKLLFSRFLVQHPGCEHSGGVTRGGTFVLLYDENATVVADLMLSYYWPESAEDEPREPEQLTAPSYKLPSLVEQSIRIQPPLDWQLRGELNNFESQLQVKLKDQFNIQKDQLQFLRDFGNILGTKNTTGPDRVIGNAVLKSLVAEVDYRRQLADDLRAAVINPGTPDDLRRLSQQELARIEGELAEAIKRSSTFMIESRVNMESSSDGINAVAAISQGLEKVSSEQILENLRAFGNRVDSPQLKRVFQLRGL